LIDTRYVRRAIVPRFHLTPMDTIFYDTGQIVRYI
jgi:hypothetical protein